MAVVASSATKREGWHISAAAIISRWTHIPVAKLVQSEKEKLGNNPENYAYGTTLMAAKLTQDGTYILHIGDGKIHAVRRNGEFFPELPEDPDCRGNSTSSLVTGDAQEKIRTADYRLSDLLVLLCVWMVVPGLLLRWEARLVHYALGSYAVSAYWTIQTIIMPTIRLSAFWLVLGLIALGLGRRENWQPAKKQKGILLVVLALCSVLGLLFAPQLAMLNDVPIEVLDMAAKTARMFSLFCWLWPLLVLQAFHRLGNDKVGPVGAGAALVGIQLGKFFLLPIVLFQFKLGLVGFGLTEGISPLFGLLILCIATHLHKKK